MPKKPRKKPTYPALPDLGQERLLRGLNPQLLERIYACEDFEELTNLTDAEIKAIEAVKRRYTKEVKFSNQKIAQAFSTSLTETATYGFMAFTVFADVLAAFGVLVLSIFSGAIFLVSIALAAFFIATIYKELDAKKNMRMEELALIGLKIEALKELTPPGTQKETRPTLIFMMLGGQHSIKNKYMKTIDSAQHKRRVAEPIIVVAATLLSTHLLAIGIVVAAAFGMSLVVFAVTPIGIGLLVASLVVSIAAGLYFGYKTHRLGQEENVVEDYHNNLRRAFNQQYQRYVNAKRKDLHADDVLANSANDTPEAPTLPPLKKMPRHDSVNTAKIGSPLLKPGTDKIFDDPDTHTRYGTFGVRAV